MKTLKNLLVGAIALSVVALASVASAEMVPQVITVVKVEGQARYSTDNKTWHKLNRGDVVKAGPQRVLGQDPRADFPPPSLWRPPPAPPPPPRCLSTGSSPRPALPDTCVNS